MGVAVKFAHVFEFDVHSCFGITRLPSTLLLDSTSGNVFETELAQLLKFSSLMSGMSKKLEVKSGNELSAEGSCFIFKQLLSSAYKDKLLLSIVFDKIKSKSSKSS